MNFQGNEAISKPTRATGRTVLFLSLLLGLTGLGWIEVTQNALIGLELKPDKFVPLLKLSCALAVVAHAVQWYSDYLSYRGWNVTGSRPGSGFWKAASGETKLQRLSVLIEALRDVEADLEKLPDHLQRVSGEIEELRWSMNSFNKFAKFYVYGWHLALPLVAVSIAFLVDRHA